MRNTEGNLPSTGRIFALHKKRNSTKPGESRGGGKLSLGRSLSFIGQQCTPDRVVPLTSGLGEREGAGRQLGYNVHLWELK